jgi:hypothetical protein
VPFGNVAQYLGSTSVPPKQKKLVPSMKVEIIVRTIPRTMKESDARLVIGKNLHKIRIRVGGDVDGHCEGKNAWDDTIKTLIPQILDISVVKWDSLEPKSFDKSRATLDKKFVYMENELSIMGFKILSKNGSKQKEIS